MYQLQPPKLQVAVKRSRTRQRLKIQLLDVTFASYVDGSEYQVLTPKVTMTTTTTKTNRTTSVDDDSVIIL
jgi:hypothetical protein